MESLISVPAAAARLGISKSKLYWLIETRQVPHYRIGPGRILLSQELLDRYLAACLVQPEVQS